MAATRIGSAGSCTSRKACVAKFLRDHPEMEFDLEEYVFSTRFRKVLKARFDAFLEGMNSAFNFEEAEKRLLKALRSGALDWIPAYQEYDRRGTLQDLPFIEKQDIRRAPQKYLSTNCPIRNLVLKTTTGSSGEPIPVWHSAAFYFEGLLFAVQKAAAFLKQNRAFTRSVFCLAVSDDRAKKDFVVVDPTNRAGLMVRVVVDEQEPASYDRVMKLVGDHRPACISSKPSILEVLASHAPSLTRGRDLAFVISSGAKLEPDVQKNLDQLFRCPITEAYGLTEFGVVAYPCVKNSLHVDTSSVFLEIIGERGQRLPRGQEGEIILSSLVNTAMPLLRYRTGDIGRLALRRCPCGSPAPVLAKISGRIVRSFQFPSGRRFAPTYFNDLFRIFPFLKEFQISQTSPLSFDVRLEMKRQVIGIVEKLELVRNYVERSLPETAMVMATHTRFPRDDKFQRFRCSL